jgi:hypothetical protein
MKLSFGYHRDHRYELYVDHLCLGIFYPTQKLLAHEDNVELKDFPTPYARYGLNLEAEAVRDLYEQLIKVLPFYANDPQRTYFELALAIDATRTSL